MRRYLTTVEREKSHFRHFDIQQVPRVENEEADRLPRLVSSDAKNMPPGVTIEHLSRPSIEAREDQKVNTLGPEAGWAAEIMRYLRDGQLPEKRDKARRIRIRASRYFLLNDILYKRGFTLPLLRCLSEEEADYVLREIHEGICGNHSG